MIQGFPDTFAYSSVVELSKRLARFNVSLQAELYNGVNELCLFRQTGYPVDYPASAEQIVIVKPCEIAWIVQYLLRQDAQSNRHVPKRIKHFLPIETSGVLHLGNCVRIDVYDLAINARLATHSYGDFFIELRLG